MRSCLLRVTGVLVASGAALGQQTPLPRFEVASIKPGGDVFQARPRRTTGRLTWTTQLGYLIGYAYHLDFSRVSGEHLGRGYSIEAICDAQATDDQVRLMVRDLLADRFKMRSHLTTEQVDGFDLVVEKAGIRMKPAEEADLEGNFVSATGPAPGVIAVKGKGASMAQLAETLARVTKTATWDRTGLGGSYNFDLRFSSTDLSVDARTETLPLAPALRESLGLTLKKAKGPVETLIVDSIEVPSEN